MNKVIEDISNKYGTYHSLMKDVEIIKFFLKRPEKEVRQKEVIEHFLGWATPKNIREHLYSLVEKGILSESPYYKGTYVFVPDRYKDFAIDCDRLVKVIVGKDLYDLAVEIWLDRHKPRDSNRDEYYYKDEIERRRIC